MSYPYWSLLCAILIPYLITFYTAYLRKKQLGKIDLKHPRQQYAQLEGQGARAVAAQSNAWEALIVFATCFLAAVAAGATPESIQLPAIIFVISRVLHAAFYLANIAPLRGLAFFGGLSSCIWIISKTL